MSQQSVFDYLRHGLTPFFRLPLADFDRSGAAVYRGAEAVFLGVPYDGGTTYQPGKYPLSYARFGHDGSTGFATRCPLASYGCIADSLVRYQVLNDPDLTPFGRGHRNAVNLGVSGGTSKLTYAITGSYADETVLHPLSDRVRNPATGCVSSVRT